MEQRQSLPDNCILIGIKPFMAYMKSVNTLFRGKNLNSIEIKARGKNIKKAIDIAESGKRKFCHDLNLKTSATIGTETFMAKNLDGNGEREVSVSIISIVLERA